MRRHCGIVLLLVLLASCSPAGAGPIRQPSSTATVTAPPATATTKPASAPLSPALALVNGTLIDGTGAAPVQNAVLIIRDGRIIATGSRSVVPVPEQAQVIDVQGDTILPGFVNAHVHGAYNLDKLEAWAQAGVTTVRDLGARSNPAPFSIRDEANRQPRYAHLVAAGPMVTVPGGYPIAIWGGTAVTATTPAEARQAVNSLLDQGADVIKIALESGQVFGQPGLPMLAPEQVKAIVAAAHQRGTLVSAHVTVSSDLGLALDGGVDDVAHMVTDRLPDELISRMVTRGAYWEPTLELWKNVGHGLDQVAIDNLRRYVAAGGRVALGTDYEGYYTPFQLGMPMHEIEGMQAAGMTPMQIITAGTRDAARVCNIGKDLGTLEVGKIADVLIVQGDPLKDLGALGMVRWVIRQGAVIRSPNP